MEALSSLSSNQKVDLATRLLNSAREKMKLHTVVADPFANFSNAWDDGVSPEETDADLRAHHNFVRTVETW